MPLESPLREEHEKAGASLATYFDCVLPEQFDDAADEYRLAREKVALLDTNYHAFVYFSGPDRVRYLNAVLTNNIKALAPDEGNVSLLLNPQGHILSEIETYALPDRLLTLSHTMVRERTVATLEKFVIMDDVTVEDVTETAGSLALEGQQAGPVLRQLCGVELERDPPGSHTEATVASVPCRIIRKSFFGQTGAEFICERGQLALLWHALLAAVRVFGGGPVGYAALNALRLEAGIPWFGYDFDDRNIPHEAALEHSHISHVKGCYTGQEIVERVRSRGHVNRWRVGLQFSGSLVPERETKLLAEGKEAGFVTSAAHSPRLNRVIGMGYVRREHNSPGSRLEWSGGQAEVIELPVGGAKAAQGAPQ